MKKIYDLRLPDLTVGRRYWMKISNKKPLKIEYLGGKSIKHLSCGGFEELPSSATIPRLIKFRQVQSRKEK